MNLFTDAIEMRTEILRGDPCEPRPFVEHFIRRTQRHHPVDRGAATNSAALQYRHRGIVRGPHCLLGEQPWHHLAFVLGEVGCVQVIAFLQDHDLAPRFGESRGRDRPAGPAADDHDISGESAVAGTRLGRSYGCGYRTRCPILGHLPSWMSRDGFVVERAITGKRSFPVECGRSSVQRRKQIELTPGRIGGVPRRQDQAAQRLVDGATKWDWSLTPSC